MGSQQWFRRPDFWVVFPAFGSESSSGLEWEGSRTQDSCMGSVLPQSPPPRSASSPKPCLHSTPTQPLPTYSVPLSPYLPLCSLSQASSCPSACSSLLTSPPPPPSLSAHLSPFHPMPQGWLLTACGRLFATFPGQHAEGVGAGEGGGKTGTQGQEGEWKRGLEADQGLWEQRGPSLWTEKCAELPGRISS